MSDRARRVMWVGWLVVVVLFAALPLALNDYWMNILILGFIASIAVYSLNVLTGYVGLLSFGQAGFVGVGAYTYGVLTLAGINAPLAALGGIVLAVLLGVLLGLPAARLKGHYLAIGTLGFGVLIAQSLNNMVDVTRGPMGLLGIHSFGWSLHAWYWIGLGLSLGLVALLNWVERHTFLGVLLKSVKYDEISASACGVAAFIVKLGAFSASAALAGFSGVLFAGYVRFLTPDLFTPENSFAFLMMAVVGGVANASGGWLSALVLTALPELLRGLGETNLRLLVYGATVLCVLWFLPQGLGGLLQTVTMRLLPRARTATTSASEPGVSSSASGPSARAGDDAHASEKAS